MIVEVGQVNWYEYLKKFGVEEVVKYGRRKNKDRYLNVYSAFDIETSTIWLNPDKKLYDVHSIMYIWQMCIEEYTVIGRTWEEFFSFLDILRKAIDQIREDNKLENKPFLVCWVHNLSYEWAFLQSQYNFNNDEIFLREERKPIYCKMFNTFELRCSYIQTNLSLSALCKQTGVKEKLSGQEFNYDIIRYPWTELTEKEIEYCVTDVESLVQAMKIRVKRDGDNLQTVPLTSTGYVRRDCKEALKPYYLSLREMKPGREVFQLLRDSFRGGNTHANKLYVDMNIEDVTSYDIESSYPAQQLTQKFPMKPFKFLPILQKDPKARVSRVFQFIGLGYAVVGRYQFKNIRLKNKHEPVPYISFSRCSAKGADLNEKGEKVNKEDLFLKLDNGRVLQCAFMEIALTEIDLKIVLSQYTYDVMDVVTAVVAEKDYLPIEYRKVIMKYYHDKTLLKGDKSPEGKYMYSKQKGMLNAVFGMSCTNPVHNDIIYDPTHDTNLAPEHKGDYYTRCYDDFEPGELEKLLKNASFPYQWGVYCTAYARYRLQEAINLTIKPDGTSNLVYCDTDSIKVIGNVNIDPLNERLKKLAVKMGATATDKNGEEHYIGVFTFDGHADFFRTQGSKRYAYIDYSKCPYPKCPYNNKMRDLVCMNITVAGVSKKINEKTGLPFAVEELKKLDRFRVGMTWFKAGGTTAVYNSKDNFFYTDPVTGNKIHFTSNVALVPSTYIMKYSEDYKLLLKDIMLYGEFRRERE